MVGPRGGEGQLIDGDDFGGVGRGMVHSESNRLNHSVRGGTCHRPP